MNHRLAAEFDAKRSSLAALCVKHGVSRLELFGSGTTDAWSETTSDLDFIVTFRTDHVMGLSDRYIDLADDLEMLFRRPVDLITPASIRNPYFREAVNASRAQVYAE